MEPQRRFRYLPGRQRSITSLVLAAMVRCSTASRSTLIRGMASAKLILARVVRAPSQGLLGWARSGILPCRSRPARSWSLVFPRVLGNAAPSRLIHRQEHCGRCVLEPFQTVVEPADLYLPTASMYCVPKEDA